jgi:flagellar motor component MotA
MKIFLKFILGIAILVVAVAVGPILMIWSLNTLFPVLAIQYTWETWIAAFLLSAPFGNSIFRKSKG